MAHSRTWKALNCVQTLQAWVSQHLFSTLSFELPTYGNIIRRLLIGISWAVTVVVVVVMVGAVVRGGVRGVGGLVRVTSGNGFVLASESGRRQVAPRRWRAVCGCQGQKLGKQIIYELVILCATFMADNPDTYFSARYLDFVVKQI